MAIGAKVRRVLGPRLERTVGRYYRSIFVDLEKEASALATVIPSGSHVLDIGGGDGEPLNYLLALRPDLRVTTLDPGPVVGRWIHNGMQKQVECMAGTSLAQYVAQALGSPDAILIADVVHHIPETARAGFLVSVRTLLDRSPRLRIIVKDVEPGHWRALLGYWSDRYITGDLGVSPISREQVVQLFESSLGPLRRQDTNLFELDRPNYAIMLSRQ